MFTALTIGSSDSSGGNGIQADLKTFTVLGVYGMSVITSVTAQNTTGTSATSCVDISLIQKQIDAVAGDIPANAFKTGLLGSAAIIAAVADSIRSNALDRYVCDPVLHAKSGLSLADNSAVHAYRQELLPLALVVTPNRAEAALLANMDIDELDNMASARKAAEKICRTGARNVVIKGINSGATITDLFYDGQSFIEFPAKRLTTKNTRGSGCTFSAIITALLAQDIQLPTAIDNARSFISQAIAHHVKLGSGTRAVNALALIPQ